MNHSDYILSLFKSYVSNPQLNISLTGKSIDISLLARLSNDIDEHKLSHKFKIGEKARKRVEENSDFFKKCCRNGATVYGVNTGYGGSADVRNDNVKENQLSLARHLNCGIRNFSLPPGIVRANMLVRANSLCMGMSGVRPEVIDLLCQMVTMDIVPEVPLRGSVSASGDLVPQSYIAGLMNGMRKKEKVFYKGIKGMTGEEVFKMNNLQFIEFEEKEALAVINSSSTAASMAAVDFFDYGICLLLTEVITAFSVEILHGRMESFDPLVYTCLHHQGMKEFSENINLLLKNSTFVRPIITIKNYNYNNTTKSTRELVQDRYAIRTSPQWMSPVVEGYIRGSLAIEVELNSANDNPVVDHESGKIIHCGNFQGASLSKIMDETRLSIQMCGRLIFAQTSEILNHHLNHFYSPNLCGSDYTKNFGMKGLDTALASYTSELEFLANPVLNHVLSAEMHNQSVNSLALISARKTKEALDLLKIIISSTLVVICQAIDLKWIGDHVLEEWEKIKKNLNCILNQDWEWYDAVFRFEKIEEKILNYIKNSIKITNEEENEKKSRKILLEYKNKCNFLLNFVKSGDHSLEIGKCLGRGTSKLYIHIRNKLKIKFYSCFNTLDEYCEQIYNYLNNREIIFILLEIFQEK